MTNNIPNDSHDAFSSTATDTSPASTRKSLTKVINSLEELTNKKAMHSKQCGDLCKKIQHEIGDIRNSSELTDRDYKIISEEIDNLSSNCQDDIKQLIDLKQKRKNKLDSAILDAKSLPSSSRHSREALRSKLGNALRETRELQHEITLHQALLQMRAWVAAPLAETTHFSSNKNDYQFDGVTKTRDVWGRKIIDMLKNVPGDCLLGFRVSGALNTYGLLMLVLDKYALTANHRMEIIVKNFDRVKVSSHVWPIIEPKLPSKNISSQDAKNADNLQQYRDAIKFLDGKVYCSELLLTVTNNLTRQANVFDVPSFNQRAKVEQIEADSLALHYGHSIIEAQNHIPSSIARNLDMSEEFSYHLINKVTENLNILSRQLKKALEQVLSNNPFRLVKTMEYRALQLLTNQEISWKTSRKPDESAEEYRLLQHCLPAFSKASGHLELLAMRIGRETKGANKARAVNSLQQLASDFRVVIKQMRTYMGELTNFDVNPQTLGESETSKAATQELQGIDWSQSPLFVNEEAAQAPQDEAVAAMPQELHQTHTETEETADTNLAMTNSQIKRQERIQRKFEKLGEQGTQQFNLSQDILNRLRAGDTSNNITAGHVEITLKSALDLKKQQLALIPDNPGLKKNIQRFEASMNNRIAEAISLRPTQQAVQNAIDKGMQVTVQRPVILPVTRDNDYVHEYVFSIQGFKFKLHAHYNILNPGPDQKPQKIHFKRMDERGTDNEGKTAYYLDDRLVRTAFRSREATEGIAIARRFLEKKDWIPEHPPVHSR